MSVRQEPSVAALFTQVLRGGEPGRPTDWSARLGEFLAGARGFVGGADSAGITVMGEDAAVDTVGATHPEAEVHDKLQEQYGEGPCLSAAWNHRTVHVADLAGDAPWPSYRAAVLAQTPIRSVLSYQLFNAKHQLSALNFYAHSPGAFDEASVQAGLSVAAHAQILWEMRHRERQFRAALASRDVIGQAKGIIMERFKIDAEQAFELIKRLSQDTNTPLAELAQRLVDADYPAGRPRPRP